MVLAFKFDNTYARLPEHFFVNISPEKVPSPDLCIFNYKLAQQLSLCEKKPPAHELVDELSGNRVPVGAQPIALAYAGHQFGYFTILGDGRAHLLGEHVSPKGKRYDIQLKGSGKTPFGRRGDGKATLGPMLREYLISEAMYALGIPSTRSLAVVTTGEQILREKLLPGAVLTRVASSHIRIGSFEYFAAKKDLSSLKILADYTLSRHYPDLLEFKNPYLALLKSFMQRQLDLVIDWLRVGFIHGVMNTDNMSLSGETIDYGPCAFMDHYHPETVFSSIDEMGRYAYANQAGIVQWNLTRFAEALLPLINNQIEIAVELATEILNEFPSLFQNKWLHMMRSKLGLIGEHPDDETLINELLAYMQNEKLDFTNTFIELANGRCVFSNVWYEKWQIRQLLNANSLVQSQTLMKQNNPQVIPRNHRVEEALQAALEGNMKPFHQLLKVLSAPYALHADSLDYQTPPNASEKVYRTFCGT